MEKTTKTEKPFADVSGTDLKTNSEIDGSGKLTPQPKETDCKVPKGETLLKLGDIYDGTPIVPYISYEKNVIYFRASCASWQLALEIERSMIESVLRAMDQDNEGSTIDLRNVPKTNVLN